ncbi:MAG TPA: alpha/beta family hydrolase [Bryobacteraceae bacterium]|nr:alpha/beta family hydrolase [Bryobacteraceae bacterium]
MPEPNKPPEALRIERELVRGWLHEPHEPEGAQRKQGLVITHGAGSNCDSPLLVAVATAFAAAGFAALRCDLPYRQLKPKGPPLFGGSARDREGLRRAAQFMREIAGDVILGGHSYGGRQASILAAEDPAVAEMLLLLSYPLHPPRKREQLRTAHFPGLLTPALFIHGTRDAFGLIEEMQEAIELIPARTKLMPVEKAGHELSLPIAPAILRETECFVNG